MEGHDKKPKEIKVEYLASFYDLPIEKPLSEWSEDEEKAYEDFRWNFNNFPHKVAKMLNDYETLQRDIPIRELLQRNGLDGEIDKDIREGVRSEKYYNGTINDFNSDILNALIHNNVDIEKLKEMFDERSELRIKITDFMNESHGAGEEIDQKLLDGSFSIGIKINELLIPVFSELLDMGYTRVDLAA